MAAVSPELLIVLALSILCGVLGAFLLANPGVRMMRGGLLYRLSVGLAAMGIVLSLNAVARLFAIVAPWPDFLLIVALILLFFIGYSAWDAASDLRAEA